MGMVQAVEIEAVGAWARSRAHAEKVEGILEGEMSRKPHSDVEEMLATRGREWARLMYEEHLAMRARWRSARR